VQPLADSRAEVAGARGDAPVAGEAAGEGGAAGTSALRGSAPRIVLAAVSGLALDGAFAPLAWSWLAPLGLAGLLVAVHGATARRGALLGGAFGLGFFLPLLHWSGTVAGAGAWLALVLLQTSLLLPVGAALAAASRHRLWPLTAPGLWVAGELLRSTVPFGGFPWGRLGFSQPEGPLTPLAALGGVPLVSAAVALLGSVAAWAVVSRGPRLRRAGALAGTGAALLAAGLAVPVPTDGEPVRVAVVQGNVPRLGLDFNAQRTAVLRNHVDATRELAAAVRAGTTPRPDLVVWPENASDIDPFTDPEAYGLIDGAVRDVGVPVLVGTLVDAGEQVDNTGVVWDPVTGPGERYVKRHPVPFGEYLPLRSLVERVTERASLVPRDFRAGERPGVLDVGPVRLGDVICFEVAYDDLVRDVVTGGGRLLVVQTNNATFGRSAETEQQLAMGRLRAVEHGRAVLVAATSGVSAVIAPDGRVVERAEVFTREVLSLDVATRDERTVATRVGRAPELALVLLGLVGLALALVRR
jgi:apolipoprotein N-acyltransferase